MNLHRNSTPESTIKPATETTDSVAPLWPKGSSSEGFMPTMHPNPTTEHENGPVHKETKP